MSDSKDSSDVVSPAPMSAPSSVPDKASEQVPDKMPAVRNAKKRNSTVRQRCPLRSEKTGW